MDAVEDPGVLCRGWEEWARERFGWLLDRRGRDLYRRTRAWVEAQEGQSLPTNTWTQWMITRDKETECLDATG